jgi:hypothetical protein
MLKDDGTGKHLLTYEVTGVIRRIPIESRGETRGHEWVRGGVLLEVFEDGVDGSAMLWLMTWKDEMIETLNTIGVGKRVRVTYHLDTREKHDNYQVSTIIDSIEGLTDAESYIYNKKK